MKNNKKKFKNTVPWLLLPIIARNENERWAKLRFWQVQTTASHCRDPDKGMCWGRSTASSLGAILKEKIIQKQQITKKIPKRMG